MKHFKHLLFISILFLCTSFINANTKQDGIQNAQKPTTVYVFGVSESLSDSIVYFSALTPVNGATLKGHGMLANHQYYSEQWHNYVQDSLGIPMQTTAVYYGKSQKKMEKKMVKVKEKIAKHSPWNTTIQCLSANDFHFKVPVLVSEEQKEF